MSSYLSPQYMIFYILICTLQTVVALCSSGDPSRHAAYARVTTVRIVFIFSSEGKLEGVSLSIVIFSLTMKRKLLFSEADN